MSAPARLLSLLPRLALAGACALPAAAAWAQGQPLDEQLVAKLAGLPPPLVQPAVTRGTVVPSQVRRWREEAQALEHGENGQPRDPARAAALYCQAAQQGDAEAQFNLAWMLTNGRGIERDDAQAAHLFLAAAEQGLPQAQRMAATLGTPRGDPPPCLRPPPIEPVAAKSPAAPPAPAPAARTVAGLSRPLPPALADAYRRAGLPVPGPVAPVRAAAPAADAPLPDNVPRPILDFVKLVAPDYQLSPQLVLAIMATESGFNPIAVSPKQAQGLMQLIPETAARFKVRNLLDPAQNIRGGMAYLRWLMAYFEGDVALVAAAYNAGEGAVDKYRGVPPYAETRHYVRKVLSMVSTLSHPFDASVTTPSPRLPLMRLAWAAPVTLQR